jgi:hypothetical protein
MEHEIYLAYSQEQSSGPCLKSQNPKPVSLVSIFSIQNAKTQNAVVTRDPFVKVIVIVNFETFLFTVPKYILITANKESGCGQNIRRN